MCLKAYIEAKEEEQGQEQDENGNEHKKKIGAGIGEEKEEGEFQSPLKLYHIDLWQVCCPQYLGGFNNSLTLTEEAVYAVDRWVKTTLGSRQADKDDIKVSG